MGVDLSFIIEGKNPGDGQWVGVCHSAFVTRGLAERHRPFFNALEAWSAYPDSTCPEVGALYTPQGDEDGLDHRADLSPLGRLFVGNSTGLGGIVPMTQFCEEWYASRSLPEPEEGVVEALLADYCRFLPFTEFRIVFNLSP